MIPILGVVDPGLMCGLLWINCITGEASGQDAHAYKTLTNIEEVLQVSSNYDITIVCERYNITQQTAKLSRQHDALETIGTLRYLCLKYAYPFELQNRSDRKKVSDNVLKAIGWYIRTPGGHTIEAARHGFVAFAKRYPNHDLVRKSIDII